LTSVTAAPIDRLFDATRRAIGKLEGSYAIVVMSSREPGRLVAAKNATPVVIGLGDDEVFVASDIPALLDYTRDVLFLEDGEVASIPIHDRGDAAVGIDLEVPVLLLLELAEADGIHVIGKPDLLEHDGGLPAIRGGSGVEVDHAGSSGRGSRHPTSRARGRAITRVRDLSARATERLAQGLAACPGMSVPKAENQHETKRYFGIFFFHIKLSLGIVIYGIRPQ